MNNRYTFKGKTKQGKWVYGNLLELKRMYSFNGIDRSDKFCLIVESSFANGGRVCVGKKHWVLRETLCQCTGLQDIDGNDIFENDIVEINDKFDGIFETNVVFKNGCFGIDMSVVKQIKNPNGWDKNYDKCESFGMNISKYKTLTKENSDMISGFGYHTDNCKIIKNKFDKEVE